MICDHCKKDPGTKPSGVWRGFKDADTGQHVCWPCKKLHYWEKFKDPALWGIYSELPVVAPPAQLCIEFKPTFKNLNKSIV